MIEKTHKENWGATGPNYVKVFALDIVGLLRTMVAHSSSIWWTMPRCPLGVAALCSCSRGVCSSADFKYCF